LGANRTPLGVQSLSTTRFSSEPSRTNSGSCEVGAFAGEDAVGADGGDDALAVDVAKSEIKSPVVGADALTGSGFFFGEGGRNGFHFVDPSESMFNFGVEFKDASKGASSVPGFGKGDDGALYTSCSSYECERECMPDVSRSINRPPTVPASRAPPSPNPSIRPPPRPPPLITDVVDDGTSL
jgi:hypothetical protein